MPTEDACLPRRGDCIPSGRIIKSIQALTTITPSGSGHPFRSGQIWNPYPRHYSGTFAFSTILYPLSQQITLRITCLSRRRNEAENRAYRVPCNADMTEMNFCMPYRLGSISPPVVQ